ncbi:hypothetical protein GCM10007907_17280 [Chitinimonas prasina]|uniref:Uncharacterized protein n=1 Tax=Chitinimonas prasina TaxID=1434937 RepID=A0ABQ5YGY3_9NEIS|nr:hypothetical protein GCM10007907_17280 [Chitinimonas prasina]
MPDMSMIVPKVSSGAIQETRPNPANSMPSTAIAVDSSADLDVILLSIYDGDSQQFRGGRSMSQV